MKFTNPHSLHPFLQVEEYICVPSDPDPCTSLMSGWWWCLYYLTHLFTHLCTSPLPKRWRYLYLYLFSSHVNSQPLSLHSPTHVLLVRCQDGGVLIWSDGRMQMIHIVASYWDFKLYIQCAFLYSMIQHSVAHYGRSLTRSVQFPPEKISFKYFCKPSASNELDTASLIARWGYLILGRAVQREVDKL